jgi:tRNA G18 (ribose-2'-O)-methylase SpoU
LNKNKFKGHVLIHNIAKPKNIGTIIRSACAFGFSTVFLISKHDKDHIKLKDIRKEFKMFGNKGTDC